MEGDSRNNKSKGVGKHSYNSKEQKRIEEIKVKKDLQRETQRDIELQKNKEASANGQSEVNIDPNFGMKKGKKLKSKVKEKEFDEYDF